MSDPENKAQYPECWTPSARAAERNSLSTELEALEQNVLSFMKQDCVQKLCKDFPELTTTLPETLSEAMWEEKRRLERAIEELTPFSRSQP